MGSKVIGHEVTVSKAMRLWKETLWSIIWTATLWSARACTAILCQQVYGQQMVNKSMDNNMGSKVLIDFIRKIAFLN